MRARTPTWSTCNDRAARRGIRRRGGGIARLVDRYQVAGPVITKHALLCKVRDAFGIDVQIVPKSDFVCDRTLQSYRFEKATRITVPSWDAMLAELVADRAFYDKAAQAGG